MRLPYRVLTLCLLPLLVVGCVARKLDQRLTEGSSARGNELTELIGLVESEPRRPISWNDAHRRMREENLGLRQSEKMLEDTEKLTRNQWLSLIPRTSAFLNISKNIASLSEFDGDSLSASLVASFNIPNPFEFHAMLYGAALQEQNARWSNQLDERRAFAELYSAFLEARLLREAETALGRRRQSLWAGDSADIAKGVNSLTKEISNMKRRLQMHRGNVNRLLNTPGANWDLEGELPAVSYRERYRSMKVGSDFGKLALNLYAVQIESAILQTQRVKFKQWPSLSFGLSNPPLYTSSGDNQFSGEDFVMFSGASKSLDPKDIGGVESIRNAEYRLKITREQLRLTMEREALRLVQIRDAYGQLLNEEGRLEKSLKRFNRPATAEVEAVLGDLELRSQLEMQLIQTRRQIKQLDLQYLIWDERFWKS